MNKSLATNLISIALAAAGPFLPVVGDHVYTIGLFATSGAITNWLAVYMLFERVPGLYGSGVIPCRFEEFKTGIRALIMNQFFTRENVEAFFEAQSADIARQFDPEPVVAVVDYDRVFEGFLEAVAQSPFGAMLAFVGGTKALAPLKDPFRRQMQAEIRTILHDTRFLQAVEAGMGQENVTAEIIGKVESIVVHRLNELTPDMVKQIVQDMIRQHLGWLVVWGGVFGGLIGLATSLFGNASTPA